MQARFRNRSSNGNGTRSGRGAWLALGWLLSACAPTMESGIEPASARVTAYLDALIGNQSEVGLQYLVLSAKGVVFEYAGGVRDAGSQAPVTPETRFLSASSTKVLTAAAALRLVEAGRLRLEDSLSTYLPWQPYPKEVSIAMLVNQSSGVPNPLPLKWVHTQTEHADYDEDAALRQVLGQHNKLEFAPGERYSYSNLSYWLLGRVLSEVSGMDYCTLLRTEISEPLGLRPAQMSCSLADSENQARGHVARYSAGGLLMRLITESSIWDEPAGKWARVHPLYMNGPAYGGVFANARGYAAFLQDLLRERSVILTEPGKRLFFSEQRDSSGRVLPTTLGWHTGQLEGVPYHSKPGGGPGFSSNLRIYRGRGLATVFLANQARVSEAEIQQFSDVIDREFIK